MNKNQADEEYRRDRIWFCFYEPRLAGQSGIEDLLRHWGGEALYNSHDSDDKMGPVLRAIGKPCLVEADVPISSLNSIGGLSLDWARAYAMRHGAHGDPVRYEACVVAPLPAARVIRVIESGDPEFARLTDCASWAPSL